MPVGDMRCGENEAQFQYSNTRKSLSDKVFEQDVSRRKESEFLRIRMRFWRDQLNSLLGESILVHRTL